MEGSSQYELPIVLN